MRRRQTVIHFLVIVTGLYITYYLWWRIGSTLNPSALFFSILLLIGEIIGILDFYMFALMTWDTSEKRMTKTSLFWKRRSSAASTYAIHTKPICSTTVTAKK
jgi:hypothetical protein